MRVTKPKTPLPGGDNPLLSALNCRQNDSVYVRWAKLGLTERIQKEILKDILPIIAPEKKLGLNEVQALIEKLLEKINDLDLRLSWQVTEYKPGDPRPITGNIVEVQGFTLAIVRHTAASPCPQEEFIRRLLYSLIAMTLEMGKLTELRKCEACNRIFVIDDPRRKFCSDDCRIAFNNKLRLRTGYFSDLRRKKKDRDLRRARK